ncbi:D-inositol-3-phosphate glycosyltransferase [uncultured archaeon]|nr:D-inositol-3-phosphate glycosyltransferase [uncultured archaeon]
MRIMVLTAKLGTSGSIAGSSFPVIEVFKRLGKKHKVFLLLPEPFFIENTKTLIINQKRFLPLAKIHAGNRELHMRKMQNVLPDTTLPKVDVVVCSYYITWKLAKRIARSQKAKLAVIYRMHNRMKQEVNDERPYENGIRDKIEMNMAHESDLIICQSEFEKKFIMDKYGAPAQKIELVPNGVDCHEVRNEREGVLFASRLEKSKGVNDFVYAARKMKKVRFLACNGGALKERLLKLRIPNLFFMGWTEHEFMNYIYSRAKILFFPSRVETFGNVPIEAMACGTPVVGYKGVGEIHIKDGYNGFIAKNKTDAVKKIKLLYANKKLWKKFSANAKKYSRKFTWDESARLWGVALFKLINRRNNP